MRESMGSKEKTAVLDFGSSKITLLVGAGEVNRSFKLIASAEGDYEGFAKGEFFDTNALRQVIADVIAEVENQLQYKLNNIIVGVPAEFCFVYDKLLTKTFNKKIKITSKIVDNLFAEDDEVCPYSTHSIINKAPLFYIINDDNKTNEPLGLIANKIQARTSYVLVENKFKLIVGGILDSLGVKNYDYISNTLAESIYLIDENKRNEGALLVDCGHITTSVCQVLGDGLKELKSFSLGGGFITNDLSRVLEIEFDEAEELKRQAIVTLSPMGVDFYQTSSGQKFSIKTVNEIVLARVDKILEAVLKCLEAFAVELPKYIPLYLTGGGLNYIEGISDYFRRELDRPVIMLSPSALLYKKPDLSSSISLLNMAINLYK
jgi:cell division protein FtsA